jgi:peptide/nickel transport system ATP-binding protein
MAVILVTHDLGVIAGRADRVAVMYAGRIAETTDTATLFDNPRHPYSEALFHALPEKAAERRERLYSIPGLPPDLINPKEACRFAPRCRYVTDRCTSEDPRLMGEDPGHQYACFHPVGGAAGRSAKVTEAAPAEVAPEGQLPAQADGRDVGEVLLSLEHLVKNFPVTKGAVLQRKIGEVSAVADVSLQIRRGETFGLVGESGCGKTTLGRLVVGLEHATSGSINFEGKDLVRTSGREYRHQRRRIQLMFQDSYASLDPRMRAGTILREPLVVQKIGNRQEQRQRVAEMLDHVGLPRTATERYPHEFSGGQRQRLGFARALVLSPDLIVADEPVSALDVSIQAQVLNLMRELQREMNLTYMFISHDLAVVRYLSNHIGVMYLGKLVEFGPADQVYLTPAHPYTRGLIDSAPVADPKKEQAKAHVGVTGELPSPINPPSGCRFRTRCPIAQEICAEVEPPLVPFSLEGHQAACHFPLKSPLSTVATEQSPAAAADSLET